jgi:hypothetical protein
VETTPDYGGVLTSETEISFKGHPCSPLTDVLLHVFEPGEMPSTEAAMTARLKEWSVWVTWFLFANNPEEHVGVFRNGVGQHFALGPSLRTTVKLMEPCPPEGVFAIVTRQTRIVNEGSWGPDLAYIRIEAVVHVPPGVWELLIKPYFEVFPGMEFSEGLRFTITGIEFKVVSQRPHKIGFVGPYTLISLPDRSEPHRLA